MNGFITIKCSDYPFELESNMNNFLALIKQVWVNSIKPKSNFFHKKKSHAPMIKK